MNMFHVCLKYCNLAGSVQAQEEAPLATDATARPACSPDCTESVATTSMCPSRSKFWPVPDIAAPFKASDEPLHHGDKPRHDSAKPSQSDSPNIDRIRFEPQKVEGEGTCELGGQADALNALANQQGCLRDQTSSEVEGFQYYLGDRSCIDAVVLDGTTQTGMC